MTPMVVLQTLSPEKKKETNKSFRHSPLKRRKNFMDMNSLRIKEQEINSFSIRVPIYEVNNGFEKSHY